MKNIDEIYKDWSGEHHTTNSCKPVHDSAETCDFAEYYYNRKKQMETKKKKGCSTMEDVFELINTEDVYIKLESIFDNYEGYERRLKAYSYLHKILQSK